MKYNILSKKLTALLLIFVMLNTGCTIRLFDFTVLSSKNVDLSRMGEYERSGKRVKGKDSAHFIIIIPTGIPNMKEAIDRAIESVPGAVALVDGVAYSKFFWAILYAQESYIFEGEALIDPDLASAQEPVEPYTVIKLDKKGDIKNKEILNEEEYLAMKRKLEKVK